MTDSTLPDKDRAARFVTRLEDVTIYRNGKKINLKKKTMKKRVSKSGKMKGKSEGRK
jgi:hypothetical protein